MEVPISVLKVGVVGNIGDKEQRRVKKKWLKGVKNTLMRRFSNTMYNDILFIAENDRLMDFLLSSNCLPIVVDRPRNVDVLVDLDRCEITFC